MQKFNPTAHEKNKVYVRTVLNVMVTIFAVLKYGNLDLGALLEFLPVVNILNDTWWGRKIALLRNLSELL